MDEPLERNRKLFYQVAEYIETYPERYDQKSWGQDLVEGEIFNGHQLNACGTHMCIAGTVAALEGWVPINLTSTDYLSPEHLWANVVNADEFGIHSVGDVAAIALGIEPFDYMSDSEHLFEENWRPAEGMTVPEVLRALGDGADIEDVSRWVEIY